MPLLLPREAARRLYRLAYAKRCEPSELLAQLILRAEEEGFSPARRPKRCEKPDQVQEVTHDHAKR